MSGGQLFRGPAKSSTTPTLHVSSSLLLSLQLGATGWTGVDGATQATSSAAPAGVGGHTRQSTQIYEGTHQIQRVVISKRLLG